ncbi:MAG TPA: hypothetical protein PLI90_10025, partial [Rhodocyclaceae bacterium]|nr:hypothetical protein [Rhodocyclaceae bacterium]
MPAAGMARRRRKARATALCGQGLPQQNLRIASLIQQPLRGRADTRVEDGKITLYGYDSRNRLNEVRDGSNSNLIARYGY